MITLCHGTVDLSFATGAVYFLRTASVNPFSQARQSRSGNVGMDFASREHGRSRSFALRSANHQFI